MRRDVVVFSVASMCLSVNCDGPTVESLDIERSFLVHRYIVRISRSSSYIKVIGSRSRSQEQKSAFVSIRAAGLPSWMAIWFSIRLCFNCLIVVFLMRLHENTRYKLNYSRPKYTNLYRMLPRCQARTSHAYAMLHETSMAYMHMTWADLFSLI